MHCQKSSSNLETLKDTYVLGSNQGILLLKVQISFPKLRSPWPAVGERGAGSIHFRHGLCTPQWNRMCRIRLFPLLFQIGCSQSSRFPTAGQGERSSGIEITQNATKLGLHPSNFSVIISHLKLPGLFSFNARKTRPSTHETRIPQFALAKGLTSLETSTSQTCYGGHLFNFK